MKELAESVKQETRDYSLIEDLMARGDWREIWIDE